MSNLEPNLAQLLRRTIEDRLLDVHTALPGVVETFYATDYTADVKVSLQRAVPTLDGEVSYEDLPVLPRVPVVYPGTARSFVQVPLQPGDRVLLLFSEQSAAEFIEGQELVQPGDLARHSLSSAFAFPIVLPSDATAGGKLALLDDVQKVLDLLKASYTVTPNDGGAAWQTALKAAASSTTLTGTAEIKGK